ncbi:hypothetical protein M885DRAFT_547108 [Pelagophyceae sp. CCMP2097]|nr:hypothetical protein M885DRAFT_547108 [Pelagophyceae sp. CCMP2097]
MAFCRLFALSAAALLRGAAAVSNDVKSAEAMRQIANSVSAYNSAGLRPETKARISRSSGGGSARRAGAAANADSRVLRDMRRVDRSRRTRVWDPSEIRAERERTPRGSNVQPRRLRGGLN